ASLPAADDARPGGGPLRAAVGRRALAAIAGATPPSGDPRRSVAGRCSAPLDRLRGGGLSRSLADRLLRHRRLDRLRLRRLLDEPAGADQRAGRRLVLLRWRAARQRPPEARRIQLPRSRRPPTAGVLGVSRVAATADLEAIAWEWVAPRNRLPRLHRLRAQQ